MKNTDIDLVIKILRTRLLLRFNFKYLYFFHQWCRRIYIHNLYQQLDDSWIYSWTVFVTKPYRIPIHRDPTVSSTKSPPNFGGNLNLFRSSSSFESQRRTSTRGNGSRSSVPLASWNAGLYYLATVTCRKHFHVGGQIILTITMFLFSHLSTIQTRVNLLMTDFFEFDFNDRSGAYSVQFLHQISPPLAMAREKKLIFESISINFILQVSSTFKVPINCCISSDVHVMPCPQNVPRPGRIQFRNNYLSNYTRWVRAKRFYTADVISTMRQSSTTDRNSNNYHYVDGQPRVSRRVRIRSAVTISREKTSSGGYGPFFSAGIFFLLILNSVYVKNADISYSPLFFPPFFSALAKQ